MKDREVSQRQPEFKKVLRNFAFIIIAVFIVGYVIFETRSIIFGSSIKISRPKDGEVFTESLINVAGQAKNASVINLNDNPITRDEEGYFEEKLLLSPGPNLIKIGIKDRFGRQKEIFLETWYKTELTSTHNTERL